MSKNDKEKKAYDEGPELLFDVADKQRKAKAAKQNEAAQTKAQEAPAEEPKQEEAPKTEEAPQEAKPAEADPKQVEEAVKAAVKDQEDKYMRLLAEYDNYRKRTQKEKEASWTNAKAETIKELLPVYDNLARVLQQKTEDEAYAKGVEMIMTQMKNALEKLGVEEIPAAGQNFDPNLHNALMHIEDETLGENVVVEVFQTGFKLGDKIIRHSGVKVAN